MFINKIRPLFTFFEQIKYKDMSNIFTFTYITPFNSYQEKSFFNINFFSHFHFNIE